MTMVIVALGLSALFVLGGFLSMRFTHGWDDMMGYILGVLPGLTGLTLALVALAAHLIPATSAWSWLPASLSCVASVSMLAYAAGAALLSRLLG